MFKLCICTGYTQLSINLIISLIFFSQSLVAYECTYIVWYEQCFLIVKRFIFDAIFPNFPCVHRRLTVRSLVLSAPFALAVHKALIKRSPCVNRSFSVYLSLSHIILYLGWWQHIQYVVYLLFFTDETQCKENSRGTQNKSFTMISYSVHISFTVHFGLLFALRLWSAFVHRSSFISSH